MPSIYVICPDLNFPSGGIKKLYDLVDCLNKNGINSYIIHASKKYRIDWFHNTTKITDYGAAKVYQNDLVIFPEVFGAEMLNYWPGVKKIIYSQNSFYALEMYQDNPEMAKKIYLHKDVVQVLVVSNYDYKLFKWLFPGIRLKRNYYGIDSNLFYFQSQKTKTIAVMPRKLPQEFNFLYNLLQIKGGLKDYQFVIIENQPPAICAQILRDARIFLSFSHREGFGLPPAEAMACGCIVIGYHGTGGSEFFKKNVSFPIESWDMFQYCNQIINVITQFEDDPGPLTAMSKQASAKILKRYSTVQEEKNLIKILSKHISS